MFGYFGCGSIETPFQRVVLPDLVQVHSSRDASLDPTDTTPLILVIVAMFPQWFVWRRL